MSFHNTVSWYKYVFFLSPQVSSSLMPAVDAKILSFFTNNPFCIPDVMVLLAALSWRRILSEVGFADIDAFPGQSEEILVSAIMDDFCFEVTVEPDLNLSVAFERGEELIFAGDNLSIEKAKEKLFEAGRMIWISSVGFTRFNSTPEWGKIASKASPSRTLRVMAAAFPS
jgi:hypothetical protein